MSFWSMHYQDNSSRIRNFAWHLCSFSKRMSALNSINSLTLVTESTGTLGKHWFPCCNFVKLKKQLSHKMHKTLGPYLSTITAEEKYYVNYTGKEYLLQKYSLVFGILHIFVVMSVPNGNLFKIFISIGKRSLQSNTQILFNKSTRFETIM